MNKVMKLLSVAAGAAAGVYAGVALASVVWARRQLGKASLAESFDPQINRMTTGQTFSAQQAFEGYTVVQRIENGIERIAYVPKVRRHATPLLFQHGMWHGAWCWQPWQAFLAERGWYSVSYSLPGHGRSPEQRPLRLCTLEYYLGFLRLEVERLYRESGERPVLVGHSMGGALTQWYLKFVQPESQALRAAVLVAPWPAFHAFAECLLAFIETDLTGMALMPLRRDASPFMRSPKAAGRFLLSRRAIITPEELYARLGSESGLVLFEQQPRRWSPPKETPPMLLLAAEADAVIPVRSMERAAAFYGAEMRIAVDCGHNVMHDEHTLRYAGWVEEWLGETVDSRQ